MLNLEEKPLVDVIIPTYNREETIINSIKSVLDQTYSNLRVIIVDDASTDNTEKLVRSIEDSRVIYLKNEKNCGANYSRNKGIKFSNAEYVAFHDSDDYWRINKLEKQMYYMQTLKDVDVIYSEFVRHCGKYNELFPNKNYTNEQRNENVFSTLLDVNIISTQTILVKRECLEKIGYFNEALPRFQDWELCLRMAKKFRFYCVNEPLVDAYFTDISISNNTKAYFEAYCIILEEFKEDFIKIGYYEEKVKHIIIEAKKEGFLYLCKEHMSQFVNKDILIDCIALVVQKDKSKYKYNVACKWLLANEKKGKGIAQYLIEQNYLRVAIYGSGYFGDVLYLQLNKDNELIIKCMIDRNATENSKNFDGMNIISMDKFFKWGNSEVDIIIVTAVADYEDVYIALKSGFNGHIMSIEEIIDIINSKDF